MKTINLKEILNKHLENIGVNGFYGMCSLEGTQINPILNAMKEACRQTLELAAENAKTKIDVNSYCGNTGSEYEPDIVVNKQSILDTINRIK